DDLFPNLQGGIRPAEFHTYLHHFAGSEVHTNGKLVTLAGGAKNLADAIRRHDEEFPELTGRVVRFNSRLRVRASLFYCLFAHNIGWFLPYVQRHEAGFVFTLYPGGGFGLDERDSD